MRSSRAALVAVLHLMPLAILVAQSKTSKTDKGHKAPVVAGPADRHLALVRPLFSGANACETVAFMDRYVRWPGNPGFDSSVANIVRRLVNAGYVEAAKATATDRLTYRVERYPMANPAWEPVDLAVSIVGADGKTTPVFTFATNRNALSQNSFPTNGTIEAELVRVADASPATLDSAKVKGKIVYVDGGAGGRRGGNVFAEAVQKRGAIGTIGYSLPAYLRAEKHRTSIQFGSIPYDSSAKAFGLMLSYAAHEQLNAALASGPVKLRVMVKSNFVSPATELTVVAEVRGSVKPDERFVYSAHIQEPGANDNASGVGALTEAARVAAELVKTRKEDPKRTLTFLWGLEIRSTARFLQQDTVRAAGVKWGMSLDMVGEDTKKTGGTFLIEKMPDPSAIWTRGEEHHTAWGGSVLTEDKMTPHYFNDFVLSRALDQAKGTDWVVKTNPYEGGSDHTPFLNAKKPGLLLWHFTDEFYHTDGDRIDKVSADELKNSGVTALISGLTLASADGATARAIIAQLEHAALARLETERQLSADVVSKGGNVEQEMHILDVWGGWYRDALKTTADIEIGGSSAATKKAIDNSVARVASATSKARNSLKLE